MRHHLLSAVLATICIGVASPVLAEDADCGLLCRINGYLSTDHMAATPNEAASAAAPKGHRAHVAHKASAKAAPKIADKEKSPVAEVVRSAAVKSATAKPVLAKATPVIASQATPAPAKTAEAVSHLAAVHPRSATRPSPRVEPKVVVEAAASPVPANPPAHRRSASARSPVQAAHGQTASVIIPGAAPAMPVGFQPFNAVSH